MMSYLETTKTHCVKSLLKCMSSEFGMSMTGKLTFFLGLQNEQ